jgi:hypothetical protein
VAAYDLSCVFHIFHRPAREFPGRIDPSDGFRERRQRRRCQTRRRRVGAVLVVVIAAVAMTFGFRAVTAESGPAAAAELAETASQSAEPTELAATASEPAAPQATELPQPVRGVHVTMSLMTLPGKLDEYLSLTDVGLNTLQIDIKDEQGRVAFSPGQSQLAREIGAVGDFYNAEDLVAKVDAAGAFLVARLVVFQDSVLAAAKPKLSIKRRGGGNWVNDAGLGWTNPYDETVWAYNVDIAIAAAEATFRQPYIAVSALVPKPTQSHSFLHTRSVDSTHTASRLAPRSSGWRRPETSALGRRPARWRAHSMSCIRWSIHPLTARVNATSTILLPRLDAS